MTTPTTSAVRAWAREQGLPVSDRGRLPDELKDAFLAAHAPARKAATGGRTAVNTPARKAAPATSAPATSAGSRSAGSKSAPATSATAKAPAPAKAGRATSAPAKAAGSKAAPAKASGSKAAPATSSPATSSPATSSPATSAPAPSAPVDAPVPAAAPRTTPAAALQEGRDSAGPAADEARFIRLEERVAALAARVDALEKPRAPEPGRRFRRRSS